MVTSAYKRNSTRRFHSSELHFPAQVLLSSSSPRMSQATRSNGGIKNGHSEGMICVECFRAKGDDGDLKLPCQNPRCHFYCNSLTLSSQSTGDVFTSEIPSPSSNSSFNKEVGHDRKTKCYNSRKTSDYDLGGYQPGQVSSKNKVWRTEQQLGPGLLSAPHVMAQMQKGRSKSLSTASTSGGGMNIQRLLNSQPPVLRKPDYFRCHMMSFPDCADSYLGKEVGRDLVEDAFVSSPLMTDYSENGDEDRVRRSLISGVGLVN